MTGIVLLGWWVGGAAGDGMGPDYWTSLNHLLADQARSLDMVDTTQEIIWRNQFCDDKVNSGATKITFDFHNIESNLLAYLAMRCDIFIDLRVLGFFD